MGDTRLDQLIKMWGYCDKMGESESEQLIGLLLAERDSLQSRLSEANSAIKITADAYQGLREERDRQLDILITASREAQTLALSLWNKHYKDESPNFQLCYTVAGVITQIDNMVAGVNEQLSEARAQRDALLIAGQPMSNACYNLSQWADRLPDGQAEVLKELHEDWDVALSSLRQQGKG